MDDFKRGLFKALSILEDYLQDIVIAGGWTPLIYYHYLLSDKSLTPLKTKDIDIVVPSGSLLHLRYTCQLPRTDARYR